MKNLKYFLEFLVISIFFIICKILGYKAASNLGYFIGKNIGPKFRSKEIIIENLKNLDPSVNEDKINEISKKCGVTMVEFY